MTAIPESRLVTIFGGSGFLGRHVVRALANAGWRIRVAVRRPNCAHFLRPMGRVGQIQLVKANVLREADVSTALDGAHAAINLVGVLTSRGRQTFEAVHVDAAGRIAQAAREASLRHLIHVSAIGANEKAPANYFRTKAQGETRMRVSFPGADIIRPAVMFGPEDNFFNRFAALARISPILPLFGGGHTRFQPIFVGDVAQAVTRLLNGAGGQTYELAGPEILTFKQILEIVLHETRRSRLLLPLPLALGRAMGAILQFLPGAPLTYDQVRMFETDTVPGGDLPGLAQLGIVPVAVEAIVPGYLWRFRKRGQFEHVPG